MTDKPSIASPKVEFDARNIVGVPEQDWDRIVTWPDTAGDIGGPYDASGGGGERRFEEFGVDGSRPQVRLRGAGSDPARIDQFTFDSSPFISSDVTFFAVISAIDLSNNLAVIGSSNSATPPRIYSIFVKTDGSVIFNRGTDPYDIISATGVVVEGGLYVITARGDGNDMILRVNGVEVGSTASGGQVIAWSAPHLFRIRDGTTGGVGDADGRDKAACWVSGYSGPASDQEIIDMEGFLAARYAVPNVVSPVALKPSIANPEFEYDVNSLGALADGDTVSTWDDQTVNGNDATAVGNPEMDSGGWLKDGVPDVRFTLPSGEAQFTDPGVAAEDEITVFLVFRLQDMSDTNALMGGNNFADRTMVEIFVRANGAIVVSFGTDEGPTLAVESAAGEILIDTNYVISFTHSSTDGKILRKKILDVDGSQIGAESSAILNLIFWGAPNFCNIVNVVRPQFVKYMWFSLYTSLAPIEQIVQMEEFLAETFLGQDPTQPFPRDVLPERVTSLATPSAVKRRTNAGLVQIRSITAIGWSWSETFGLLRVTESEHMELMAFVKKVWHAGEAFKIRHPMQPGSGIPPNGLGTANIMVVGAGQVGNEILTDGWPADTANCVVVGDVVSIAGEVAVYMVTATADSNGSGEVLIGVNPPLRSSPANNAIVKTDEVDFIGTIMGRSRFEPNRAPTSYAGMNIRVEESLL